MFKYALLPFYSKVTKDATQQLKCVVQEFRPPDGLIHHNYVPPPQNPVNRTHFWLLLATVKQGRRLLQFPVLGFSSPSEASRDSPLPPMFPPYSGQNHVGRPWDWDSSHFLAAPGPPWTCFLHATHGHRSFSCCSYTFFQPLSIVQSPTHVQGCCSNSHTFQYQFSVFIQLLYYITTDWEICK